MTTIDPDKVEHLRATLEPWLGRHRRPAWKKQPTLQLQSGSVDDSATPTCGACNNALELLLRLDTASLPRDLHHPLSEGVIELFYCFDEDWCETEKWEPYSEAHHIRLVAYDVKTNQGATDSTDQGWTRSVEPPSLDDLRMLGATIEFSSDGFNLSVPEAAIEINQIAYGEYLDAVIGTPGGGYKLGGWPSWIQSRQHPVCRDCEREMTFLYQVAEQFGDGGCGYLFYCGDHPNVMAFLWQCH